MKTTGEIHEKNFSDFEFIDTKNNYELFQFKQSLRNMVGIEYIRRLTRTSDRMV
jgi:hypothetical protein